jgi:hypothetical protein
MAKNPRAERKKDGHSPQIGVITPWIDIPRLISIFRSCFRATPRLFCICLRQIFA